MQFIRNGRLVDSATLEAEKSIAPKRKASVVGKPEAWHKGWAVEGFPPGYRAECQSTAEAACARWLAMSDEGRRRAINSGSREPKP